jgi:hypothetical protein
VTIQWHICPFVGFARDVASGSVSTRVYVRLLARVRVGERLEGEEWGWISKTGGEEVSDGEMELPRETSWWDGG